MDHFSEEVVNALTELVKGGVDSVNSFWTLYCVVAFRLARLCLLVARLTVP